MKFQSFLIKYAEIGIKGKNRYLFEDALVKQIRRAVRQVEGTFEVSKAMGRIYVNATSEYDYDELIEALQCVFGIVHICPVVQIPDEGFDDLAEKIVAYMDEMYPDKHLTFKVECRRSRKNYPLNSQEMNRELGGRILDAFADMRVDVHHPQVMLKVEVREQFINVYSLEIPGPRRNAHRDKRKGHASAVRRNRQSGGGLYDRKTGRLFGCHLFPCTAVYQ